jgi:hypothetical protein
MTHIAQTDLRIEVLALEIVLHLIRVRMREVALRRVHHIPTTATLVSTLLRPVPVEERKH